MNTQRTWLMNPNVSPEKNLRRILVVIMALPVVLIAAQVVRQPGVVGGEQGKVPAPAYGTAASGVLSAGFVPAAPRAAEEPAPSAPSSPPTPAISKTQLEKGKRAYAHACLVCHQPNGQGVPNVFPPLAQSDYLMADKERSIRIVLEGQTGEIVVNGMRYNGVMPPILLNDEQVANVLTYVRNAWGNSGDPVTAAEVRAVRDEIKRGQSLASY